MIAEAWPGKLPNMLGTPGWRTASTSVRFDGLQAREIAGPKSGALPRPAAHADPYATVAVGSGRRPAVGTPPLQNADLKVGATSPARVPAGRASG